VLLVVLMVCGELNVFPEEVCLNSVSVNVIVPSLPVCSLCSSRLLTLKIVTLAFVRAEPVLLLTLT